MCIRDSDIEGQYMGLVRLTSTGWQELLQIGYKQTVKEFDAMDFNGTLQQIIDSGNTNI